MEKTKKKIKTKYKVYQKKKIKVKKFPCSSNEEARPEKIKGAFKGFVTVRVLIPAKIFSDGFFTANGR